MDEEKVVKMIQSCLILDKKCVTTRELTRLFRDQVGSSIPFARLGYPTLVSFLKTIPGVHKAGTALDGDILLGYDASHSNMGHIQELIQRQQAKRKPSSAKYSVKRPMQVSQSRFRYSQSMRSYHQQQMSLPKWPKHPSVEMHRPISSAPVAKQNYFATAGPSRPSPSSFRNTNLQVAKEEPFFKQQKPYEESIPASDVPKKASYESGQGDRKSISFTSEQKENLFANLDLHKQINYLHKQFNSQNKVTSGSENVNPACGFKPITDVEMDNNAKLNMKDADVVDNGSFGKILKETHEIAKDDPATVMVKEPIVKPPKSPRTENPMIRNHQLVGDDFLMYLAFRNLRGVMRKGFPETNSLYCGFCFSGATTHKAIRYLRDFKDFIWHKKIVMLGHMDILEEGYNFEKSKYNMSVILEDLYWQGTKTKVLTLPFLDHHPGSEKYIHEWNNWIRTLTKKDYVEEVLDLEKAITSEMPIQDVYKTHRHYPRGMNFTIGMWSHSTRAYIQKFLHENAGIRY